MTRDSAGHLIKLQQQQRQTPLYCITSIRKKGHQGHNRQLNSQLNSTRLDSKCAQMHIKMKNAQIKANN